MENPLARATFGRRLGVISHQIELAVGQNVIPLLAELRQPVDVAEVERLAASLTRGERDALARAIEQRRMEGQSSEHLCLTLLTLLARRLGEWWEQDRCTFVEVTLGMIVLHEQLRSLAPGLAPTPRIGGSRSALMMTSIGNQHGMGIAMVAEFFRAGGWAVVDDPVDSEAALLARVAEQWFGLVAISVASTEAMPGLASQITAIRRHSRNPEVAVMLGGPALLAEPGLAGALGADATAPDAAEALRRAEALVALMTAAP
ncbi:cobalamin B12-binding domain-containing protein [Roseococcus sp. SDR]|uniref:cobalamin B12-binding domain-containing protein n=1 Tax=Roseococcus sp. SDR TaxID=2835532 RepID=UPI001BCFD734|nr:cobalamin B12-binding domain-containing protein [Roseococcus sp. SDR]MBS7789901.1 cobalamin B12-binding domain-containing protein [Roseococcus sp. SDR]MBV1845215.1 cobalamin B12-binding domain-containing protein [Roseococcus sp. SDR]